MPTYLRDQNSHRRDIPKLPRSSGRVRNDFPPPLDHVAPPPSDEKLNKGEDDECEDIHFVVKQCGGKKRGLARREFVSDVTIPDIPDILRNLYRAATAAQATMFLTMAGVVIMMIIRSHRR